MVSMKFEAIKPTIPAEEPVVLSEAEKQEKMALLKELENQIKAVEAGQRDLKEAITTAEGGGGWSKVSLMRRLLQTELSQVKAIQRKLEGKSELIISADYAYKDEEGKEIIENIELDFDLQIDSMINLYNKHLIVLPADFREQMQTIWAENTEAIQEAIKEKGFNQVLFISETLPRIKDLEAEMTEGYKEEFEKKNPGKTGEETYFGVRVDSITETVRTGARMILVHDAPDLTAQPELKKTLGKEYGGEKENGKDNKAQDFIDQGEALTLSDYLLLQRLVFEKTGVHLDSKKTPDGSYIYWTWLPGSRVGGRVVRAYFSPGDGRLSVDADDSDYANPTIGCRPSRCFFKK